MVARPRGAGHGHPARCRPLTADRDPASLAVDVFESRDREDCSDDPATAQPRPARPGPGCDPDPSSHVTRGQRPAATRRTRTPPYTSYGPLPPDPPAARAKSGRGRILLFVGVGVVVLGLLAGAVVLYLSTGDSGAEVADLGRGDCVQSAAIADARLTSRTWKSSPATRLTTPRSWRPGASRTPRNRRMRACRPSPMKEPRWPRSRSRIGRSGRSRRATTSPAWWSAPTSRVRSCSDLQGVRTMSEVAGTNPARA